MKLIIIDRDGVINEESADYVKTPEEWHPIPGSLEAITKLHQANWRIIIASNQSAIGRGLMTADDLGEIQQKMDDALHELGGRIDGLFFCPHPPDANCDCRKPRPGLLKNIAMRLHTSIIDVPFIGDTQKDIDAAKAVKARPMLVLTGKGKKTKQAPEFPDDVPVYKNLMAATEALLLENEPHE